MKRIFVNDEVCMGCGLCRVYCQAQHSRFSDLVKAFRKDAAVPRLRVEVKKPVSFPVPCHHCPDAPCAAACLTGALERQEDGAVVVNSERCLGCWTCVLACPLGALSRDTGGHRVLKCDLCRGAETPACVANCPNEALVYAEASEGEG